MICCAYNQFCKFITFSKYIHFHHLNLPLHWNALHPIWFDNSSRVEGNPPPRQLELKLSKFKIGIKAIKNFLYTFLKFILIPNATYIVLLSCYYLVLCNIVDIKLIIPNSTHHSLFFLMQGCNIHKTLSLLFARLLQYSILAKSASYPRLCILPSNRKYKCFVQEDI